MRLELRHCEVVLDGDYDDEPGFYHDDIEAGLFGGEDGEELIGKASASIFRHECAMARGVCLFEVGDSVDQETHDAWWAVMTHRAHAIREALSRGRGPYSRQNLLYIKTMQIPATHRGHGAGLFIMQRIMKRFGPGCGIAVIEPSPLNTEALPQNEWRTRMEWDSFGPRDEGARKLARYWKRVGFRPVPGTKQRHWYYDLENDGVPEDFDISDPLEVNDSDAP
jgi:hypothetical protein